ncbi:MBL fold metallo-hydrolase [Streptomyces sp. QTS52]
MAVPGHTPGSVAFQLPTQGVVFTGDALVTMTARWASPAPGPRSSARYSPTTRRRRERHWRR